MASNPIERLRKYVSVLIPVFTTACRQVGIRLMALVDRGIDGGSARTFYNRRAYQPADWLASRMALGIDAGSDVLISAR